VHLVGFYSILQNTYIRNTSEKCIKEQDPKEAHRYLGIQESYETQHKNKNDKLSRFRLVLGTELSAKNTIQAIGSMAVPILRYSFGTVNWQQEELQNLDRKTSKLPTIHGKHRPKADADRLYVPRKQGGRGLMQLEKAYAVEITKLVEYAHRNKDPLIQIVRMHQHNINSTVLQTPKRLKTEVQ
jgi:hypothetical protein